MKNKALLTLLIIGSLVGCKSSSDDVSFVGDVQTSVKSEHRFERVKIPNTSSASITDYVYFAANKAHSKSYKKFALVQVYKKGEFGKFYPDHISSFMFQTDQQLELIKKYDKKSKPLKVIGVFDSEEYKDKRYIPVNNFPGAA
ncbi:hypothetical protein [Veronia pacifica]|uniref:Lipoprotein n=1 Tax=Veronia pacifica TaxID=1080227 RepID=A0A1C3ESH7_9GAMM|nr:hypothetical protein [Veronia pacifica]ODA36210.1 hypothetical protein A8L45_00990 [Veronia pacifica]